MAVESLLNILTEYRIITKDEAEAVLSVHRQTGQTPGQILTEKKIVTERSFYTFICNQLGMNPKKMYSDRAYTVSGISIPKFSVSGDFYGYFPLEEGRVAITLSDVSGKGLEAGILAILLADLLKRSIHLKNTIPSIIMRKINELGTQFFDISQFATFMVMIVDFYSGIVEFCGAGTPPVLLYRNQGREVEEFPAKGIPIGIDENFIYNGGRFQLSNGDVVLIYTDGAYEAQNLAKEYYGTERIKDMLIQTAHLPPYKILSKMKRKLKRFTFLKGLNDDTTYIAIKRHSPPVAKGKKRILIVR